MGMIGWQLAVPAAVDGVGVLHRNADVGEHLGQLRCAGCGTPVEAVAPHTRRSEEAPIRVRAHFRLVSGGTHAAACPFDFPRAAARIARAAPEVVRARPGGYLLTVPEVPGRDFAGPGRAWRPRRAGTAAGFLAGEAVTAMGKVAGLLHRFGGQRAAPGAFAAVRRHHVFAWPEICFDEHSYADLVALLGAGGHHVAAAVLFRVERAGQAASGDSWWLGESSRQRAVVDYSGHIRVTVRARDRRLLVGVSLGVQALAYGDWQLRRPGPAPGGRKAAPAFDLVCWLNEPWQLRPAGE